MTISRASLFALLLASPALGQSYTAVTAGVPCRNAGNAVCISTAPVWLGVNTTTRTTDAVFTASGTAIIHSTSATAGMDVFQVWSATRAVLLVVQQDGSVGIGTTAPAHRLDVSGGANVSSGVTASSLTLTGTPLALAYGGSSKALTASNGAVVFSDADSMEFTAAGSSGQFLRSVGAGTPLWTTPGASGLGDAILAATQTFSGANTFASSTTHSGQFIATGRSSFTWTGADSVSLAVSSGLALGNVTVGKEGTLSYAQSVGDLHVGSGTVHMTGWKTWTPTWAAITIGNATVSARYSQVGKTVNVRLSMTVGSTTTMGEARFTLPVTAAAYATTDYYGGTCGFFDTGVQIYIGGVRVQSATEGRAEVYVPDSTYLYRVQTTTTAPFTWVAGDILQCGFTYEAL